VDLVLIGYFPKLVYQKPPELLPEIPSVKDIYSVSDCLSEGPPGWLDKWLHNEMFVYDSPELAWSVVPEVDKDRYTLFAYRLAPCLFDEKGEEAWPLPELSVSPLPTYFSLVGYDAVSRTYDACFECSPLSCNSMAKLYPVNEHCLVDSLDAAISMARDFAVGQCEPGPYCVVEVWKGA
jgi:hypothetical protein